MTIGPKAKIIFRVFIYLDNRLKNPTVPYHLKLLKGSTINLFPSDLADLFFENLKPSINIKNDNPIFKLRIAKYGIAIRVDKLSKAKSAPVMINTHLESSTTSPNDLPDEAESNLDLVSSESGFNTI